MKANESPVKVENIPHPSLAMDKTPGTLLNMKKSGKRMFIPQKDGEQLMLTTMKPILTTIKLWISWGKTHVNHAKKKNSPSLPVPDLEVANGRQTAASPEDQWKFWVGAPGTVAFL